MHHFIRLFFIFTLFLLPAYLPAQVFPKENSVLTYRIIGFSFTAVPDCSSYLIEVATGYQTGEALFKKNIIVSERSDVNRHISEVPAFGQKYTWRVLSTHKNGKTASGPLHHFGTGYSELVDSTCTRFRIAANSGKYESAYIFLDQGKVMYDMKGHPVWYLPSIDQAVNDKATPRDMKITSGQSITFIASGTAYEITYDGQVLWKSDGGDSTPNNKQAYFHHEFTRLANGHYMAMGMEPTVLHLKNSQSEQLNPAMASNRPGDSLSTTAPPLKFMSGTLLEYDAKGNEVWSWMSSSYFENEGSDFYYNKLPDGQVNTDVHDNSFCFDEKDSVIYISYKNINRIIKIKYPEGKVLAEYGPRFKSGIQPENSGWFCSQHCVRRSEHGYLCLYNNNSCNTAEFPRVVIVKESATHANSLELVWEYECDNTGIARDENRTGRSATGGSVEELQDGSILVCMGTPCSKVFIVSRDKKELWSGFSEVWKNHLQKWDMQALYRASFIRDRNELSKLIWKSQEEALGK